MVFCKNGSSHPQKQDKNKNPDDWQSLKPLKHVHKHSWKHSNTGTMENLKIEETFKKLWLINVCAEIFYYLVPRNIF